MHVTHAAIRTKMLCSAEMCSMQVKDICSLVADRSARLMAATVVGLLTHLGRVGSTGSAPKNVLAIDGGILINWPNYRLQMKVRLCCPSLPSRRSPWLDLGFRALICW